MYILEQHTSLLLCFNLIIEAAFTLFPHINGGKFFCQSQAFSRSYKHNNEHQFIIRIFCTCLVVHTVTNPVGILLGFCVATSRYHLPALFSTTLTTWGCMELYSIPLSGIDCQPFELQNTRNDCQRYTVSTGRPC